ncbi:metalloregulator ArsR/SmtB family transcription factor [Candidatus Xianfuyuplasma coldseepsis]|uniref:metalloregulator ArsR/SmtB family transcription factor n=1 Tax=Candidatus Xianfuyuplasma coldseepsis TaxID=2782163 RepID=UPI0021623CF2|nr:metalloregulator ArsR/SmtB family transcription factor [Xianfuyuplasma coldseepsis]
MEYEKVFKVLSDKSRLRILATLLKEPMYVELLANRLDLHPSTVSFHLKKLERAGMVSSVKEQYYVMYSINKKVLNINVMQILSSMRTSSQTEEEREEEYNQKILSNFFKDGILQSIPVQLKKRKIVLEKIAQSFDCNRTYTEKEVNHIISDFHPDFCTIRREFIMNKMFTRENGIYQKIK